MDAPLHKAIDFSKHRLYKICIVRVDFKNLTWGESYDYNDIFNLGYGNRYDNSIMVIDDGTDILKILSRVGDNIEPFGILRKHVTKILTLKY